MPFVFYKESESLRAPRLRQARLCTSCQLASALAIIMHPHATYRLCSNTFGKHQTLEESSTPCLALRRVPEARGVHLRHTALSVCLLVGTQTILVLSNSEKNAMSLMDLAENFYYDRWISVARPKYIETIRAPSKQSGAIYL